MTDRDNVFTALAPGDFITHSVPLVRSIGGVDYEMLASFKCLTMPDDFIVEGQLDIDRMSGVL